jgi:hypothetical protein
MNGKSLLLLLALTFGFGYEAKSQDAIINEWSQGRQTLTAEWVEILIVKDNLSLAGWSLRENEPTPQILFQFADNFPALPAGTIILVYMQPENCGCTYPDDYNPNMPELNAVNTCDLSFDPQDPKFVNISLTRWSKGNNSANNRPGDNYVLYDNANNIVHDWDHNDKPEFTASPPRPSSGQAVYYTGNDVNGITDPANWKNVPWNADELTPGKPNGGANTAFINGLKATAASLVQLASPQFITVPESAGNQTIKIQICNPKPTPRTLEVKLTGMGGNPGVYGVDFVTVPDGSTGTITLPIPANRDTASFIIQNLNDCIAETQKQTLFEIQNGDQLQVGGASSILYTITDDDASGNELRFRVFTRRHTTCANCTDGAIVAQAWGGKAPYTFKSGNRTFDINVLTNVGKGKHSVEVTDANGCTAVKEIEVR